MKTPPVNLIISDVQLAHLYELNHWLCVFASVSAMTFCSGIAIILLRSSGVDIARADSGPLAFALAGVMFACSCVISYHQRKYLALLKRQTVEWFVAGANQAELSRAQR